MIKVFLKIVSNTEELIQRCKFYKNTAQAELKGHLCNKYIERTIM